MSSESLIVSDRYGRVWKKSNDSAAMTAASTPGRPSTEPGTEGDGQREHEHGDLRLDLAPHRHHRRGHDERREPGEGDDEAGLAPMADHDAPSRARLSSSTLTPGSPRKPSDRPSVWSSTSVEHGFQRQRRGLGHPRRLELGVGHRDVRVEARPRGGDRVDGHAGVGGQAVLVAVGDHPFLHGGDELRVGGSEVRRRRDVVGQVGRVGRLAVDLRTRGPGSGRRRAAVEVLLAGELLADEAGPDRPAVGLDERAVGLVGEQHLGHAGHGERVGEAGDHGEGEEHPEGREQLAAHVS